jgi:hypothetical protein
MSALVDIYWIAKSGLNSRTCRHDYRKANEESDTTHRTTLHKLLFDHQFFETEIRVAAAICRAELAGQELPEMSETTEHKVAQPAAVVTGPVRNTARRLQLYFVTDSRQGRCLEPEIAAAFVERGEPATQAT